MSNNITLTVKEYENLVHVAYSAEEQVRMWEETTKAQAPSMVDRNASPLPSAPTQWMEQRAKRDLIDKVQRWRKAR